VEASVEARLESIEQRLQRLETLVEPVAPSPPARPIPTTSPAHPAPMPQPREAFDLEALLGGRVLGWVGGIAVFLAAVFFLVMAVHNGWIDEPTRVVLAFVASTLLLAVGLWLYERRGQTQAALAAVAAATASLYASDTTATVVYHLVSAPVGLGIAGLVGIAATSIAVRWDSRVVAGIGIGGALLAPVFVHARTGGGSLAFMTIALVSAVGVLLWRRWSWLASIAYVVSLPQAAAWIVDERHAHLGRALGVTAAFWTLYVVAALGFELRVPTKTLRLSSALLLFANAAATAAGGWAMLHDAGHGEGATAWVVAAALVYVGLGAAVLRGAISRDIGALLLAVGSALAAIGMALALDGPALVAGWSAEAVLVAWVAKRNDDVRGQLAAAVFLVLAGGHVLLQEAPPRALAYGVHSLPHALVALALVLAAAVATAVTLRDSERPGQARVLGYVAAGWAVYAGSVFVVDISGAHPGTVVQNAQFALSAFWAALGFAALLAGLARDVRPLRIAGLALLGLAVAKVFVADLASLGSMWRVASFLALGLLLLAAAYAYQRSRAGGRRT
jgi:uncharacterized membrane protein